MKKKDFGVIALVAVISAVMSILISGSLFSGEDAIQKAEIVEEISTNFETPEANSQYFNSNSVNPAQDIQIGQDPGSNPFRGR